MKSPLTHLVFALIMGAALLATYGVWYAAVSAKSASVTALQGQIDTKTETIKRLATTRATFAEMAGDEAVVQGYFVPETGVVSFIDSLESRGDSLGATVNVLSVSTSKTSAQPSLELSLAINGTFDAVMRTVGAIEYAPYALSIMSLSVEQEAGGVWRANIQISVGSVPAASSGPNAGGTKKP